MRRASFKVMSDDSEKSLGSSIRRKNRSASLHGNALKISSWNNPDGIEVTESIKSKKKSQRGPGLREMLYGIAAKREKEEAAQRKRQKKIAGMFSKLKN
uniref:Uncharacterized protein n=1 Tax=Strongyloides venezuelensis TaxID=75913 RepID=A0A0K0FBE9_STRVS